MEFQTNSKRHHSNKRPPHRSAPASNSTSNTHSSASSSSKQQSISSDTSHTSPAWTALNVPWTGTVKENSKDSQKRGAEHSKESRDWSWIIGTWLQIKTAGEEEMEGQVFAFDGSSGTIVLQTPSLAQRDPSLPLSSSRKFDFNVISIPFIKAMTPLPHPPSKYSSYLTNLNDSIDFSQPKDGKGTLNPNLQTLIPFSEVSIEKIKSRELESLKNMEGKIMKIGVGVTKAGQDIFDALNKTMECRWHEQTIVVMNLVLIPPPYAPDICKSNDKQALARVRKVLDGERKRLGLSAPPTVMSQSHTSKPVASVQSSSAQSDSQPSSIVSTKGKSPSSKSPKAGKDLKDMKEGKGKGK